MISDNLTTLTNPTVTDVAKAFDNSLNGLLIFGLLIAFLLVLGMAVFSISREPIHSFLYAGYMTTISAFFLILFRQTYWKQKYYKIVTNVLLLQ